MSEMLHNMPATDINSKLHQQLASTPQNVAAALSLPKSVNLADNIDKHEDIGPPTLMADDPRTLQLALELSMASLSNCDTFSNNSISSQSQNCNTFEMNATSSASSQNSFYNHQQHQQIDLSTLNAISAAVAISAAAQQSNLSNKIDYTANNPADPLLAATSSLPAANLDERSKKSQNMTECVPVPSSEHVAEIVGRQGCKIKALRAKTNTYIKTPVRNEEPVFVVTGRKEDVAKAKREILSAAEHFSLIRATRKTLQLNMNAGNSVGSGANGGIGVDSNNSNSGGPAGVGRGPHGPPSLPGQVTIQVRVPYRVVGLVVGPKGATIKHIQQETQTYIVTPSREKEPIFEVTGLPDNVQTARKQIEAHIALRTGSNPSNGVNLLPNEGLNSDDTATAIGTVLNATNNMHTLNTLSQILNEDMNQELLESLYKNGIYSVFDYAEGNAIPSNNGGNFVESNEAVGSSCINTNTNDSHSTFVAQTTSPTFLLTSLNNPTFSKLKNGGDYACNNMVVFSGSSKHAEEDAKLKQFGHSNGKDQNDIVAAVASHHHNASNSNGAIIASNNNATRSCSSASSTTSSKSFNNGSSNGSVSRPELLHFWKNISDSLDVDEGISESPSAWHAVQASSQRKIIHPNEVSLKITRSSSTSISPTDSLLGDNSGHQVQANKLHSAFNINEISEAPKATTTSPLADTVAAQQQQQNHNISKNPIRTCALCNKKDMLTAFLPCGHDIFCVNCVSAPASGVGSAQHLCPVCNSRFHASSLLP